MITRTLAKAIKLFIAGTGVALFLGSSADAGPFEDGMAAFHRKDFAGSLTLWRPLAEHGDPAAQAMLGIMYDDGDGVPQDRTEAAKWYYKAAAGGDADGQYLLGTMFALGYGVPQDFVQARMWFDLAATRLPASASDRRDLAIKGRDLADHHLTASQIADAQRQESVWIANASRRTGSGAAGR
jgi:uncharacterized protein